MFQDTFLYDILGVQPGASLPELRRQYFLQAREFHPDRNLSDPTAGQKFQMLGEAFQVLSDPHQRKDYDLYGKSGIRIDGLVAAGVVYGMMFGSDSFEDYLGQSRLASVAAFSGDGSREAVLGSLRMAQKEREAKLAQSLAERLSRFREGEQETHFGNWTREEARQLADTEFGTELLSRIGTMYERRAAAAVSGSSSFLGTPRGGTADWTRQASDTVSSQVSAAAGAVQALAMKEEADDVDGDGQGRDLTEEALNGFFDTSPRGSMEAMWKIHLADINATVGSVCRRVLSDPTCDQETLRSRVEALKRLGSTFLAMAGQSQHKEASNIAGAVLAGGSSVVAQPYVTAGGRFSAYSPPSSPSHSGFRAANNPSLQGMHQTEQGYAGLQQAATAHEQFLAGEQLGSGLANDASPLHRGDGSDLGMVGSDGMPRGSKMYHSRYFIIKSLNHQNIASSIEKGCWATQAMNEPKLNEAYDTAENVVLIFSVNMSGHFQGYARMMSPIGRRRANIWNESNDGGAPWGGLFSVQWERLYDLPFQKTVHLKNPLNMFKPVKISRDCQELTSEIGEALCGLIDEGADKEGRPKRKVIAGDYSTQDAGMKRPRGSEQMYFSSEPPFPGGGQAPAPGHAMHMAPPPQSNMMYRNMPSRFMPGGGPALGPGYPGAGGMGGRALPALHSPYSTPDLDFPGGRGRRQVSAVSPGKSGEEGEKEREHRLSREKLRILGESERLMRERGVEMEDELESPGGGGTGGWLASRQEAKRVGGARKSTGRGVPPEEELLSMTYEDYLQRLGGGGGSFSGYEGGARSGYSSAQRKAPGYSGGYAMPTGAGYGVAGIDGMYGSSMTYRASRPPMGGVSDSYGGMDLYGASMGMGASAYDETWGTTMPQEGYGSASHLQRQPHPGMLGGAARGSRNLPRE
eukprot:TRINITY_DN629_c0_g1_i8.p1 TRINITY_DN629_c0_g1~~TRINITY_DN629_c0_g1_i8.p1  ORF type:complete len:917 (-),score=153.42 TRINITY_DN629_c0_g1_i8:1669-4419(-)